MVTLITLRERCFSGQFFKGYIDNVTETLFFSLLFNGYIDSATGTLIFIFLTGYIENVTRTLFFSSVFNCARARVCVCTCMRTCVHFCKYVHVCTYTYVYADVCTCVHSCARGARAYACEYVSVCACNIIGSSIRLHQSLEWDHHNTKILLDCLNIILVTKGHRPSH